MPFLYAILKQAHILALELFARHCINVTLFNITHKNSISTHSLSCSQWLFCSHTTKSLLNQGGINWRSNIGTMHTERSWSCILSVASRNLRLSYQITKWHINAAYITVTYIVLIRKAWGKNFSLVKLECFHTKVEHFCSAHTRVVAPFHIFYIRKKLIRMIGFLFLLTKFWQYAFMRWAFFEILPCNSYRGASTFHNIGCCLRGAIL